MSIASLACIWVYDVYFSTIDSWTACLRALSRRARGVSLEEMPVPGCLGSSCRKARLSLATESYGTLDSVAEQRSAHLWLSNVSPSPFGLSVLACSTFPGAQRRSFSLAQGSHDGISHSSLCLCSSPHPHQTHDSSGRWSVQPARRLDDLQYRSAWLGYHHEFGRTARPIVVMPSGAGFSVL